MDHLALLEFFVPHQNPQQGRLARPIAAYETDLFVVGQRQFGSIEQNLVCIAFVSIADLDQNRHGLEGEIDKRDLAERVPATDWQKVDSNALATNDAKEGSQEQADSIPAYSGEALFSKLQPVR